MSLVRIERASTPPPPPPPPGPDPRVFYGSGDPVAQALIDGMFKGSGNWLTTPLPDNTAVAPTSADAVDYVAKINTGARWLNGVNGPAWTSLIYIVPADQPLVPVVPRGNATQNYAWHLQAFMADGVPIPDGIPPFTPGDGDSSLIIYQPDWEHDFGSWKSRGRIYEFHGTQHPSVSESGGWEAYWAGRYVGVKDDQAGHWFDWWWGQADYPNQWTKDGIAMAHDMGAMATSIPMSHTLVMQRDVLRGHIDHVLGLELPLTWQDAQPPAHNLGAYVWPAQRWDGASHYRCQQGFRFRFPHNYPINPSWPWLTKLLVQGVRDHGLVFCDTVGSDTGPTIRMEVGAAALVPGGVNMSEIQAFPWADLQQIKIGNDTTPNPLA